MHLKFTNEVGVSQFYRPDVMAGHYDPPGVRVWEDDAGVRHFKVVAEVGEALLDEEAFAEYDGADDTPDE
jgi:hypothetical protein